MNEHNSHPDTQAPRKPTGEELSQLADWLLSQGYFQDDATWIAQAAFVSVFDRYVTGGPGYSGKLLSVVWDGSPSTYDVFTWHDGKMVHCGREYDQKECGRCGKKDGTSQRSRQ